MRSKINLRTNQWLKTRLCEVWRLYFSDIAKSNQVYIRFGRPARTRLGSIKLGRRKTNPNSFITLTGLFRHEEVPTFVIDAVLAHELTHYSQGFSSPHRKLYDMPHAHRVVDRELTRRGLADTIVLQKRWLKKDWPVFLRNHGRSMYILSNRARRNEHTVRV